MPGAAGRQQGLARQLDLRSKPLVNVLQHVRSGVRLGDADLDLDLDLRCGGEPLSEGRSELCCLRVGDCARCRRPSS